MQGERVTEEVPSDHTHAELPYQSKDLFLTNTGTIQSDTPWVYHKYFYLKYYV